MLVLPAVSWWAADDKRGTRSRQPTEAGGEKQTDDNLGRRQHQSARSRGRYLGIWNFVQEMNSLYIFCGFLHGFRAFFCRCTVSLVSRVPLTCKTLGVNRSSCRAATAMKVVYSCYSSSRVDSSFSRLLIALSSLPVLTVIVKPLFGVDLLALL